MQGMSCSEEDSVVDSDNVPRKFEPDPQKVEFFFTMTGKSIPPGVLHSHGSYFKWYRAGKSKDGRHLYFTCSEKKHLGCLARATVEVVEPSDVDGQTVYRLVEIAAPEYHGEWHTGDNSKNISHQILQIMKAEIEKNPCNKIGECFF